MANSWPISLLDVASDAAVAAHIQDEIGQEQLVDWERHWRPAVIARLHEARSSDAINLPQNAHWNWNRKVQMVEGLLGFRGFSVIAQGMTQGLCSIDLTVEGRLPGQGGKPIVYIDYLETAPWNRIELGYNPPTYRGVGSALIVAACELSREEGFKGRIGLHSLPQADKFYRSIGMTEVGSDPKKQNLIYFEMTQAQTEMFLSGE